MYKDILCPYFGKKKMLCRAGTDYVNIAEAKEVVKICIEKYENCQRFIQLSAMSFCFNNKFNREGVYGKI